MRIGEHVRFSNAFNLNGWNVDGHWVDVDIVIPAGTECVIEKLYDGDDWHFDGCYEVTAVDGSFGKLMLGEVDLLELLEPVRD